MPTTNMPAEYNPTGGTLTVHDLRPLIDRNNTNGLSRTEVIRDQIHELFTEVVNARHLNVLVLKSPPFTSPPWVSVQCWVHHASDPALTLRSAVQFNVRSREFHRFDHEIDMVITDDKRNRTIRSIIEFDRSNVENVLAYLLFETRSLSFGFRRCRAWGIDFWRPLNKPARLGVDPAAIMVQVFFVLGICTISFGVGALFLLGGGALAYANGRRRRHVLSAGKPSQEPRRLIRLDSWQALVRGIGSEQETVIAAIQTELGKVADDSFVLANEQIWYWGVDGKEERVQLVARYRRGIAFIQIYRYGADLFVGWDAHVNCGTWVEKVAGGGYDKSTRELCAVHTIVPGWHTPNEYDVSDTNCLLERVHAAVVQIVKLKLVEHRIDQEIDFKILREPRQNIAGRSDDAGGAAAGMRKALTKIRRIG